MLSGLIIHNFNFRRPGRHTAVMSWHQPLMIRGRDRLNQWCVLYKRGSDDAGVGTRGTPLRRPWSFPVRKASPRRCVGGGGEIQQRGRSRAQEKLTKDRVERIDPWFWPASSVETKLGKVSAAGYHGWTARLSRGKAPMYDKGRKKDGNLELKRKRNSKKSSISK